MLDIAFIWLLLSHLTVVFPCYLGFKENREKWYHIIISLIFTSFFSTIYHLVDLPNIEKEDFIFLGLPHKVYKGIDYFGSYFSIFIIMLSVIHPKIISEYFSVLLVFISFFSCFFSIHIVPWYYFIFFLLFFSLVYSYISKETSPYYILKSFNRFRLYSSLGFFTLFLSICMQYYFALYYDTQNYPIYHGFWHFFMFLSSGFWIKWNNQLINYQRLRENRLTAYSADSE